MRRNTLRYRPLGASGIQASVVALGAWAIGGWPWGGTSEEEAVDAIRAGMDAGINFIDTAPAYGLGLSERIVGQAVAGQRDKAVIATKCGLVWHVKSGNYFFDEMGTTVYRSLKPDTIRYELEQSLIRLHTDYIDLYQTHWPDIDTPVEDTMATLLDLKAQGKIRAIGVSNVDVDLLKQYTKKGVVDTDQELFSMLDREVEEELLPYCRENNISMLAYSPLAQGLLTGKITPEREFKEGDFRQSNPRFSVENRIRIMQMLKKFEPVIDKHQISFSQLAIAWTFSQPGMTHALVGARNSYQATENAAAGDIMLDDEDMGIINGAINEVALAQ